MGQAGGALAQPAERASRSRSPGGAAPERPGALLLSLARGAKRAVELPERPSACMDMVFGHRLALLVRPDGGTELWDLDTGKRGQAPPGAGALEAVLGLADVREVCGGEGRHLVLRKSGELLEWTGGEPSRLVPLAFGGATKVAQVACGPRHALAVDICGALYSWGDGANGRLGQGTADDCARPRLVHELRRHGERVVQASAGAKHNLALTGDCRVFSWGCGGDGRLGHGDEQDEFYPREIQELLLGQATDGADSVRTNVTADLPFCSVSAGEAHSAIATSAGFLLTFGSNTSGQLGQPPQLLAAPLPRLVASLARDGIPVAQCACGPSYTLALGLNGCVVVMGALVPPRESDESAPLLPPRLLELSGVPVRAAWVHEQGILALPGGQARAPLAPEERREGPRRSRLPLAEPLPPLLRGDDAAAGALGALATSKKKPAATATTTAAGELCQHHKAFPGPQYAAGSSNTLASCVLCCQDMVLSLSRQLQEHQAAHKKERETLARERRDAARFRAACARTDSIEAHVKDLLSEVSTLGLQSRSVAGLGARICDTVQELHSRLLFLEARNEELELEAAQLSRAALSAPAALHLPREPAPDFGERASPLVEESPMSPPVGVWALPRGFPEADRQAKGQETRPPSPAPRCHKEHGDLDEEQHQEASEEEDDEEEEDDWRIFATSDAVVVVHERE